MLISARILFPLGFICACCLVVWWAFTPVRAQNPLNQSQSFKPSIAPASRDAELAIKQFQVAPGLKVDLWAAEPLLANPVAFNFDEQGRAYVCETFRHGAGVDDIRGMMDRLDEELAARTVDDHLAEMKQRLGERIAKYTINSERVQRLEDRDGDGKADRSTIFAEGFNTPLDGIGAGVLARKGSVWYANIPNLWLLRDTNADGVADSYESLHYGFGVRVGFLGHDLHGLHFGPDGKLYFSIGDRGSNVRVADGRWVGEPDTGCVFRCNPDGSELEVFAFGLRNPQDLVFDNYGNLFTGDNNSDSGDQARWVYLVEGGDNGWRVGYQFMGGSYSRGPFNAEKLWYPPFDGQAAYLVPPVTNIANGPSGVAYFPGTGLPARYQGHFFLVDFRGGSANSGIHTFTLKARGAGFELQNPQPFIWSVLATDTKFGVDGGLYLTDWVEGWKTTGKGRIYRVHDPALAHDPLVIETRRLLGRGMEKASSQELARLLAHPDLRVRQAAQFELAGRGTPATKTFGPVARQNANQLARLHAIWGLGQIISKFREPASQPELGGCLELLIRLLRDRDPEVRAQAAKGLGERRVQKAFDGLLKLLQDESLRGRFFAAMSLGKLGRSQAIPAMLAMLRENADKDPWLRHAGVMGLTWIGDTDALLAAGRDSSTAVRMGALLALRRLQRSEVAMFLKDNDPAIVLEAARAINDQPINGAMPELASLIAQPGGSEPLLRRVLNANFRSGAAENARALAAFASRNDGSNDSRVEALTELANWQHPSGRDRVMGLWRPIATARSPEVAREALQPVLEDLLRSAPNAVRVGAIHAASRLTITNAGPVLAELVGDSTVDAKVRVEALKTLAALKDDRLEAAMKAAQADANEDLRKTAIESQLLVKGSNAAASLTAALEHGTLGEKQAALAALGTLPGVSADETVGHWLDDLKSGRVTPELQLDVLEAAAKRESAAVEQKLATYKNGRPLDDPLSDYRETLFGGDAAQGRKIFFEHPEASCVRCHRINGEGGDVGPDLSHIGAQKPREYLLESIVVPNKQIAPGFDSVSVVLKNDDSYAGVLKSETTDELVISSPQSGLITLKKSDVQSRRKALSPMPEDMGKLLSKRDLRDLVEFLSGLK